MKRYATALLTIGLVAATFGLALAIDAATAYLVVRIAEHTKSKLPLRIYSAIHFGAAGWNAVQIARTKR
jgi:hypothetical protein